MDLEKIFNIVYRKVFYQNKNELGNIEDVYGTVSNYGFVVELSQNISAESFKSGDIIYGDAYNMLPLERFLEGDKKPKSRDKALNQQGNFHIFNNYI